MQGTVCVLILAFAIPIMGCTGQGMSQSDRDHAIQDCLMEIETIQNDPTMNAEIKRDLIERCQLQLKELKGE